MTAGPVVVLGFGAAAMSAVVAMREAGYTGPVTVVTDADARPYSPVLTSYYAGGSIQREQCFIWSDANLSSLVDDVRPWARIASVDAAAHEVVLSSGERIRYAKLLVATGAHPVAPGIPRAGSYEPLVLRTMRDADRLRGVLERGGNARVLVSGTSMVGMKVVDACLASGAHATLLGRSGHVMRATAHPRIAARFEQLLAQRGVDLRLSQGMARISDVSGTACTVEFDNGEAERFDAVVAAQGVAPNLDFLAQPSKPSSSYEKAAGDAPKASKPIEAPSFEIERGLLVDQFMRTSVPDVFAAGDVAQALDLCSGERRVRGLWINAVQQGRCAGRAIADELTGCPPRMPYCGSIPSNVVHVGDVAMASAGVIEEGQARHIEVLESGYAMRLLVYEVRDGKEQLVGFNMVSVLGTREANDEFDVEAGRYRRDIINTFG